MKAVTLLLLFVAIAVGASGDYMIKLRDGVQPAEFAHSNDLVYVKRVGKTDYHLFAPQPALKAHLSRANLYHRKRGEIPADYHMAEVHYAENLKKHEDVQHLRYDEELLFVSTAAPAGFDAVKQAHLVQIGVDKAWDSNVSGKEVEIMLVDNDGPYSLNAALTGRVLQQQSFNFPKSQEIGRNPAPRVEDCLVNTPCSHGTSMATLMAARAGGCLPGPAYNAYVAATNRPRTVANFLDAYSVEADVVYSPLSRLYCEPNDGKVYTEQLNAAGTGPAIAGQNIFTAATPLTCSYKTSGDLVDAQITTASTEYRRNTKDGTTALGIFHIFPAGNLITPRKPDGSVVTANIPTVTSAEDTFGFSILNNPWVYVVGGVTELNQADPYSRGGSAVFVSAPVGTTAKPLQYSTTVFNDAGVAQADSCAAQLEFGTSNAGALLTGVVALMLEADRNLTPRDIADILITTSTLTTPLTTSIDNGKIVTNGAGRRWSPYRGFGTIDANKAVARALDATRVPLAPLLTETFSPITFPATAGNGGILYSAGATPATPDSRTFEFFVSGVNMATVETFSVVFSAIILGIGGKAPTDNMGALEIKVTSAKGTVITLKKASVLSGGVALKNVRITTRALYGEDPRGMWKLDFKFSRALTPTGNLQIQSITPSVWGAKGTVATAKCCSGTINQVTQTPVWFMYQNSRGAPPASVPPKYALNDKNVLVAAAGAFTGAGGATFEASKTYTYKVGIPTFPLLKPDDQPNGLFGGNVNSLPDVYREIALKRPFIHRCTLIVQKNSAGVTPWGDVSLRFWGGFSNSLTDVHTLYTEASLRVQRNNAVTSHTLEISRAFRAAENPQQCYFIVAADSASDDILTKRQTLKTVVNMAIVEEILPADTIIAEDNSVEISLANLVRVVS